MARAYTVHVLFVRDSPSGVRIRGAAIGLAPVSTRYLPASARRTQWRTTDRSGTATFTIPQLGAYEIRTHVQGELLVARYPFTYDNETVLLIVESPRYVAAESPRYRIS